MKSKKTLVLSVSIFVLTLSAFPHQAAASSTTTPPPASPLACSGKHIKSVTVDLVILALALLRQ
jgi:hypothetical protein